ncbi:MAG: hypothetical protein D6785_05130, partial [Planctomycetota bacterium]
MIENERIQGLLLLIALLLGGYILIFERKPSSFPRENQQDSRVLNLDSQQVLEIEWKSSKDHILLRKLAPKTWVVQNLKSGEKDRADSQMVGDILRSLEGIFYDDRIEAKKVSKNMKALGLLPPSLEVRIRSGFGEDVLYWGKFLGPKEKSFLKKGKWIYQVDGVYARIFQQSFSALREHRIFLDTLEDYAAILLKTPEQIIVFYHQKKKWKWAFFPAFLDFSRKIRKKTKIDPLIYLEVIPHLFHAQGSHEPTIPLWSLSQNLLSSQTELDMDLEPERLHALQEVLDHLRGEEFLKGTPDQLMDLRFSSQNALVTLILKSPQGKKKILPFWKKDGYFYTFLDTPLRKAILKWKVKHNKKTPIPV